MTINLVIRENKDAASMGETFMVNSRAQQCRRVAGYHDVERARAEDCPGASFVVPSKHAPTRQSIPPNGGMLPRLRIKGNLALVRRGTSFIS